MGLGQKKIYMGKIVLIVSEVSKSSASMRITYPLQRIGQRSSSARNHLASSVTAESSWLEISMR